MISGFPTTVARVQKVVAAAVMLFAVTNASADTTSTANNADSATSGPRIISIGSGASLSLAALGLADAVVARDMTSEYPPEIAAKPSIGMPFVLNAEALMALKPTHLVGPNTMKPTVALEQLEKAGVKVFVREGPKTLAEAANTLESLGKAVGREEQAKVLVEKIRADTEVFERAAAADTTPAPKVAVLYFQGPLMSLVMGKGTDSGAMVEVAGGKNVFPDLDRSRPLNAEALAAAAPDVIVTIAHAAKAAGGVEGILKKPGVAMTPAGKARRIVIVADHLLTGFGPDVATTAQKLREAIYRGKGVVEITGK